MTWADKLEFYDMLLSRGSLKEKDFEPSVAGFEYYVNAFYELSTCRQFGMGEGPIPFTAMIQFATMVEEESIEDFCYIIRRMDDAYLRFKEKKNGREASKGNSSKAGHKGK